MSAENKKIILISVLAAVLGALVLVYIFVIMPMIEEQETQGGSNNSVSEPPPIDVGEGLYNDTMVTIYPQLNKADITYLEITNKHGTYAFHRYFDSTMDAEEMRIKGHEQIKHDESMYSLLIAYVYLPVSYQSHSEENAPMRDVSDEKMREYGVTEDTCQASYTVGYKDDDGITRYHTVYIGHATFSDETTYYVALKGRNSVYRFHQEGVEQCLLASLEDYISPLIYVRFESSLVAMATVEKFRIGVSDPSKIGTDGYLVDLVDIRKSGQNLDGTTNMYDLYYRSRGTGKITKTGASADQLNAAFTAFYTYFVGDKVISINPTDEELIKYGLDLNSPCYFVAAQLSNDENDSYSFQISELQDGYYYTISNMFGDDNRMLIRVPKSTLSFLGTDDESVFEWAGTDVSSLFYEYLKRNDDEGQPGMYQLDIRIQKKYDATGEITYDTRESFKIAADGKDSIVATTTNGTKFETVNDVNQFINFYTLLIRLPAPTEFNNLTQEQIDSLLADDTAVVFELIARDNDNKVFKYTYYQIGNSVDVMVATREGHMEGGAVTWDEELQINFNTTLSQIDILRENFQKLLNGEEVEL